jgi:2-dehydropantoate 2-reductase
LSHVKEHGVIKKGSPNFYLLFGTEKKYENLKALEEILNNCGLKNKYSKNIKYDCWKKYLFISAMASLTSYFKEPMGYVAQEKSELLADVIEEIKTVANKKGVEINDEDVAKTIKQASNVPYGSKTSMQLDFEKGKSTEVESLTGFIVIEAKTLGIEVPKMKTIYNSLIYDK